MSRLTGVAFIALLASCFVTLPSARGAATEASISAATANGTLAGTLTIPDARGPVPVALIVSGSGPTNRDGSNPLGVTVTPYRLLAHALSQRGIASVRYDKRGVAQSAQSAPLGTPATFDAYVDDVVAWVRELHDDKRFSRVVLVGHSEGSLLALLAAAKVRVDGVVSLDGAGRPAPDILVEQVRASGAPAETVSRARQVAAAIRAGASPGDVPADMALLFPPYLRTYERQWFSVDPAAAARAISVPLLVVQGGADIQIGAEDAHRIVDAHPAAALRIFPHMTHVLVDANGTDRAASLATYTDTSLPLDSGMVDAVAAFVLQQPLPPQVTRPDATTR